MAQSGFTPISLYFSATGAAVPTAANLVAGELALNTNDGKLYFKNSAGVVTLLAGSSSGPAGGSNTQVQYNNSGVLAGITGATTNGTVLTLVTPVLGVATATSLQGIIGNVTPAAGAFTSLTASTTLGVTGRASFGTSPPASGALAIKADTSADAISIAGRAADGVANINLFANNGTTYQGYISATSTGVNFGIGGAAVFGYTTAGLAVTGTLSATGTLSGGTSGTAYSFSGSAPATSLTLDSSGNLGVGTTSPSSRLDVRGSSPIIRVEPDSGTQAASFQAINDSKTSYFGRENSAGNYFFAATVTPYSTVISAYNSTAPIIFGHSQPEVYIANGGNVGIGTSSPTVKLDIKGGNGNQAIFNNAGERYTQVSWQNNGTSKGTIYTDNTTSLFELVASSGVGMTFHTNGAEKMRLDTSGIVTMNAYGAGAATFSAAGVISSVSDETWKIKDGVPTDPDAMLKKLNPGYWYYNNEKKETFGADRQLGFYAQNVNAAIGPEAAPTPETFITKNEDGSETTVTKPWGYYDRSVLAITVMSLQKALATIETLTARITALETA